MKKTYDLFFMVLIVSGIALSCLLAESNDSDKDVKTGDIKVSITGNEPRPYEFVIKVYLNKIPNIPPNPIPDWFNTMPEDHSLIWDWMDQYGDSISQYNALAVLNYIFDSIGYNLHLRDRFRFYLEQSYDSLNMDSMGNGTFTDVPVGCYQLVYVPYDTITDTTNHAILIDSATQLYQLPERGGPIDKILSFVSDGIDFIKVASDSVSIVELTNIQFKGFRNYEAEGHKYWVPKYIIREGNNEKNTE